MEIGTGIAIAGMWLSIGLYGGMTKDQNGYVVISLLAFLATLAIVLFG